jgi:DNA replication protein DnaC
MAHRINNQQYLNAIKESNRDLIPKKMFLNYFKEVSREFLGKEYVINKTNENIVYSLFKYFCGDKNFNLNIVSNNQSINKGVLIYGGVGVGKSLFFKILKEIGKRLYFEHGVKSLLFKEISCGSFVNLYMLASTSNTMSMDLSSYYKGRLYIDDLGFEQLCFNKYELLEQLLFERHRAGSLTFVTTNLTPIQIVQRYGERIGSRLNEMFNIIEWKGDDFRDNL